ncbi:phospho-N-acetylmuramoyl-pentapeptide-transferase [bacterium]|nr:phospho-N-acetylmuramoyl-pentapeptide-transferase [candidate division CSSED10-310 bacterium]
MFYWLYEVLYDPDTPFKILRLFKYLTFRTIYSTVTAFLLSFLLGPVMIRWLKRAQIKDESWKQGMIDVAHKSGTPTMGGLLIIIAFLIPSLLWCNLANPYVQVILTATIWFGLLGGLDDYLKLKRGKSGLAERYKYIGQIVFGTGLAITLLYTTYSPLPGNLAPALFIPFIKGPILNLGILYLVFITLVIVGSTNAVNMTDGLDGLAIVPVMLVSVIMGVFAYVMGNIKHAEYLHYAYLDGAGEICVICAAVAGAGIGFLWYNTYPAQLFMGDIGSLALGGVLGTVAILIKQEFILFLAGGVFVIEAASVLLQKYIFTNWVGRRLFMRAPLHDTFKYRGIAEPKVVVRFWIISVIFALLSLSTLKLR